MRAALAAIGSKQFSAEMCGPALTSEAENPEWNVLPSPRVSRDLVAPNRTSNHSETIVSRLASHDRCALVSPHLSLPSMWPLRALAQCLQRRVLSLS